MVYHPIAEALESGDFPSGKKLYQFFWDVGVSYPYIWVNVKITS